MASDKPYYKFFQSEMLSFAKEGHNTDVYGQREKALSDISNFGLSVPPRGITYSNKHNLRHKMWLNKSFFDTVKSYFVFSTELDTGPR